MWSPVQSDPWYEADISSSLSPSKNFDTTIDAREEDLFQNHEYNIFYHFFTWLPNVSWTLIIFGPRNATNIGIPHDVMIYDTK